MSQEIVKNADGTFSEKLIQRVCKNCGRIELRCKCTKPQIETIETIRPYNPPVDPTLSANNIMEAQRIDIVAEKFAKKAEKAARQAETIRVAGMTDEELAEEEAQERSIAKEEKEIAERNQIAIKNVEAIRLLKSKLMSEGKSKNEVKAAVKELKKSLSMNIEEEDNAVEEQSDEKSLNKKNAGRPRKDALINPKKDPKSGEFYSTEEKE